MYSIIILISKRDANHLTICLCAGAGASPITGASEITEEVEDLFVLGLMYIVVSSAEAPEGEIRGQIHVQAVVQDDDGEIPIAAIVVVAVFAVFLIALLAVLMYRRKGGDRGGRGVPATTTQVQYAGFSKAAMKEPLVSDY